MRALRTTILMATIAVTGAVGGAIWAEARQAAAPNLADLMRSELEGVDGTEVIVSLAEMPPGYEFPLHYHPGEEFVYVLEGSGVARVDGEDDTDVVAGEVLRIPLERVHTARAGDEGLTVLVFRVHRTGRPDRILVEK